MKLQIGDTVRFLNEKGEGTVSKILNKTTVSVTIADGLDIPYLISELVVIMDESKPREKVDPQPTELKPKPKPVKHERKGIKRSKPHAQNAPHNAMEIDLHIEELVDNFSRMSNFEIVQVQLAHFNKALDNAINGHYRKLVVIHGVGNGRLKQEVRNILSSYSNVRFHDASYAKYGFGATEILIH